MRLVWLVVVVGCGSRIEPPPPPAPPDPVVVVDSLPVVTPPPAPTETMAPPAEPAPAETAAVEPGSTRDGRASDPFVSDTVDNNREGKHIMERALRVPEADPPSSPPAP